jgi:hypothetical protein
MTLTPSFSRRLRLFLHSLGLSCLGGAIFLQVLVFADIVQHGYFMAVEQNPAILAFEVALTGFAAVYFVYIYQRLMRSVK